ncbi:TPA_asm: IS3 family transposase [Listeria monocytogenes]|nr:IS3 family transposase [Listeria monocytogenes]
MHTLNRQFHFLTVYTETKYRLGAAKIQVLLKRDYGISISAGRVYRLMKSMDLPKMPTSKPTAIKNRRFLWLLSTC